MNVEYKVFSEVSVIIAQIGKGDKCFLLRSDMDALPVEEETGLEFASKNGCMHGCGQDLHATIWEGYNYEDAVLLSEKLVQNDVYTSVHIEVGRYTTRHRKSFQGK